MQPKPRANGTTVTEFILLGLVETPELLFLFIYPITVIGNMLIILAIHSDSRLHNPMYFFLANLSLVDIFFSSVTIPKMLANHIVGSKAISFGGCLAQMFFMIGLANTDSYILAAMAYDRAVAISRPLHYATIMSPRPCILLVAGSWVIGNGNSLVHTLLTASLSFCGNKDVANFYCDITPLLQLSCSDCIIISYVRVFSTVLRAPSTKGFHKALSTCGSHLTVVALYYGTVMGMYFRPLNSYSLKHALITVMYTTVTPMLNPFIYSLRNRDMKAALRRLFHRSSFSSSM
ncbi:Olfactory receptor 1A1 [Lemmus lemmus]